MNQFKFSLIDIIFGCVYLYIFNILGLSLGRFPLESSLLYGDYSMWNFVFQVSFLLSNFLSKGVYSKILPLSLILVITLIFWVARERKKNGSTGGIKQFINSILFILLFVLITGFIALVAQDSPIYGVPAFIIGAYVSSKIVELIDKLGFWGLFFDDNQNSTQKRQEKDWYGFKQMTKYIFGADNKNGQGTHTYSSGNKYVGEFKDGKRHGYGTYSFVNGDKYIGEFSEDLFSGQGTMIYANGEKYVGKWKDGVANGQGTYTFEDGTVQSGLWINGELFIG